MQILDQQWKCIMQQPPIRLSAPVLKQGHCVSRNQKALK